MFALTAVQYCYQQQPVLNIADWQGEAGSQWLVIGASGSGKTTLLHLMAGLLRPQQGTIVIQHQALNPLNERQRDQFRAKHLGMVLQRLHLVKPLTVFDNLRLAQQLAGLKPDRKRIEQVLTQLNLTQWQHALPATLSQGQAQRVAIARAVLHRPQLILADEPTASLDDAHCQQVVQLLQSQAAEYGATLVIATHDARLKAVFPQQWSLEGAA